MSSPLLGGLRAILLGLLLVFLQSVVAIPMRVELQEPALQPEEAVKSALELTVVDGVHGEAHMSTEQQMQLAQQRVQRLQAAMAVIEKAMNEGRTELEAFQNAEWSPLGKIKGDLKNLEADMNRAKAAIEKGLAFYKLKIKPWVR